MNKILLDKEYINILNLISNKLDISYESIYGYNYNTILSGISKKKSIIYFIGWLTLPILLLILLLKPNKRNKNTYDVAFEEWRSDTFEDYYKILCDSLLSYKIVRVMYHKNAISTNKIFNYIYINDFVNKKVVIKILFLLLLNLKLVYVIIILSIKYKINLNYVFFKLLLAYVKYESFVSNLKSKVYFSALDLNAHLLKYEVLKKYNIKYILLQSSMRVKEVLYYKGSDIIYCYGSVQSKLYEHSTNNFTSIILSGSIKNSLLSNEIFDKKYDILFVEQFGDCSKLLYCSNDNYILILKNLIKFSREYPKYKILYKTRQEKRLARKNLISFNAIFKELENSNIIIDAEDNSYEKVKSSKVVIGYYSALCFESIGIDTPCIFFYYDNCNFELFDFIKSEEDILIRDKSYDKFRTSLLMRLNSDNVEYFKKYKYLYMNQDNMLYNTVVEQIKKYI